MFDTCLKHSHSPASSQKSFWKRDKQQQSNLSKNLLNLLKLQHRQGCHHIKRNLHNIRLWNEAGRSCSSSSPTPNVNDPTGVTKQTKIPNYRVKLPSECVSFKTACSFSNSVCCYLPSHPIEPLCEGTRTRFWATTCCFKVNFHPLSLGKIFTWSQEVNCFLHDEPLDCNIQKSWWRKEKNRQGPEHPLASHWEKRKTYKKHEETVQQLLVTPL